MSSEDAVIRVERLSKCYHVYRNPKDRLKQSLLYRLQRLMLRKAARAPKLFTEHWALKETTFKIRQGETVGIVGRNGSGKSTLLQLICGTLTPTTGECKIRGRVAALLELGSGFNPHCTGLENVYLYGQILGMSRQHIERILPNILAFADIGDYIYQPVKTYSNGMQVRLAFAVSVSREPNILVVDEALAVGDEAFRRKCFARIEALRENGTTILFVSHSAALVIELCSRALLLDGGEVLFDGSPKEVIAHYNKLLFAPNARRDSIKKQIRDSSEFSTTQLPGPVDQKNPRKPGLKTDRAQYIDGLISKSKLEYERCGAEILDPHIETVDGFRVNVLVAMQEYQYCYRVRFLEDSYQVQFGMLINTTSGVHIGGANHPEVNKYIPHVNAGEIYQVNFSFRALMNPGTYFFNAGLQGEVGSQSDRVYLHRIIDAVMFRVQPYDGRITNALVNFDVATMATLTEEHSNA